MFDGNTKTYYMFYTAVTNGTRPSDLGKVKAMLSLAINSRNPYLLLFQGKHRRAKERMLTGPLMCVPLQGVTGRLEATRLRLSYIGMVQEWYAKYPTDRGPCMLTGLWQLLCF